MFVVDKRLTTTTTTTVTKMVTKDASGTSKPIPPPKPVPHPPAAAEEEKEGEASGVVEEVKSYSDRKTFWEDMTQQSQAHVTTTTTEVKTKTTAPAVDQRVPSTEPTPAAEVSKTTTTTEVKTTTSAEEHRVAPTEAVPTPAVEASKKQPPLSLSSTELTTSTERSLSFSDQEESDDYERRISVIEALREEHAAREEVFAEPPRPSSPPAKAAKPVTPPKPASPPATKPDTPPKPVTPPKSLKEEQFARVEVLTEQQKVPQKIAEPESPPKPVIAKKPESPKSAEKPESPKPTIAKKPDSPKEAEKPESPKPAIAEKPDSPKQFEVREELVKREMVEPLKPVPPPKTTKPESPPVKEEHVTREVVVTEQSQKSVLPAKAPVKEEQEATEVVFTKVSQTSVPPAKAAEPESPPKPAPATKPALKEEQISTEVVFTKVSQASVSSAKAPEPEHPKPTPAKKPDTPQLVFQQPSQESLSPSPSEIKLIVHSAVEKIIDVAQEMAQEIDVVPEEQQHGGDVFQVQEEKDSSAVKKDVSFSEARVVAQEEMEKKQEKETSAKKDVSLSEVHEEKESSAVKKDVSLSEARMVAQGVVSGIELEVSKCSSLLSKAVGGEALSAVPGEARRRLTVEESSSMEITDEELRSSGDDVTPPESKAKKLALISDAAAVQRTLSEVKDSLEMAHDELIDVKRKHRQPVALEPSPSEFRISPLAFGASAATGAAASAAQQQRVPPPLEEDDREQVTEGIVHEAELIVSEISSQAEKRLSTEHLVFEAKEEHLPETREMTQERTMSDAGARPKVEKPPRKDKKPSEECESPSSGREETMVRFEPGSSSGGESHYYSPQSGSRPCSSDVELLLMQHGGTGASSEYESALATRDHSHKSGTASSTQEYHTAVSSGSASASSGRESAKSIESDSSGNMASVEISSETSETLVPSAMELERDIETPLIEEDLQPLIGIDAPSSSTTTRERKLEYKESEDLHDDEFEPGQAAGQGLDREAYMSTVVYDISEENVMEHPIIEENGSGSALEDMPDVYGVGAEGGGDSHPDEFNKPRLIRSMEMTFHPEPRLFVSGGADDVIGTPSESPGSHAADGEAAGMTETIEDVSEKLCSSMEDAMKSSSGSSKSETVVKTVQEGAAAAGDGKALAEQGQHTDSTTVSDLSMSMSSTEQLQSSQVASMSSLEKLPTSQEQTTRKDGKPKIPEIQMSHHTSSTETSTPILSPVPTYASVTILSTVSSVAPTTGATSVSTQVTSEVYEKSVSEDISEGADDSDKQETDSTADEKDRHTPSDKHDKDGATGSGSKSSGYGTGSGGGSGTGGSQGEQPKSDDKKGSDKGSGGDGGGGGSGNKEEMAAYEEKDVDESKTEAPVDYHQSNIIVDSVFIEPNIVGEVYDPTGVDAELKGLCRSESGFRYSAEYSYLDPRPDSEIKEIMKRSSSECRREIRDPIERPKTPEPSDDCELKDDTPEFSSETQASVAELELEYSSAYSRTVECVTHASPITEETHDEHASLYTASTAEKSSGKDEKPELQRMELKELTEKHELETSERFPAEKEQTRSHLLISHHQQQTKQLKEQVFESGKDHSPSKPSSMSSSSHSSHLSPGSELSSGTTDEGREYVLEEGGDTILEEAEYESEAQHHSFSVSEDESTVNLTIRNTVCSPSLVAAELKEVAYFPSDDGDMPRTGPRSSETLESLLEEEPFEFEQPKSDDGDQPVGGETTAESTQKWTQLEFGEEPTDARSYNYQMRFERPSDSEYPSFLEDIEEEEHNTEAEKKELERLKETLRGTPDFDVLAGRKFFQRKSSEQDDGSLASLQEFERLEHDVALDTGSQCSLDSPISTKNRSFPPKAGQSDTQSISSLTEFEKLEQVCIEADRIEKKVCEEEALLSEIEEGHESQISESDSCETLSDGGQDDEDRNLTDSEDYEKRMFEIDEIIKQAQGNVETFEKDESGGGGLSVAEIMEIGVHSVYEDDTEHSLLSRTESAARGDVEDECDTDSLDGASEMEYDQRKTQRRTKRRKVVSYGGGSGGQQQQGMATGAHDQRLNIGYGHHLASKFDQMQSSSDSVDVAAALAQRSAAAADDMGTSADSIELQKTLSAVAETMATSADSLELEAAMRRSINSMNNSADSVALAAKLMTVSADSLELDNSKPVCSSSDQLDNRLTQASDLRTTYVSDSSTTVAHSSSGEQIGDYGYDSASCGGVTIATIAQNVDNGRVIDCRYKYQSKDDNGVGRGGAAAGVAVNAPVGSTPGSCESLELGSSSAGTATHAFQSSYDTDSVISGSLTSDSRTLVSSTETLDADTTAGCVLDTSPEHDYRLDDSGKDMFDDRKTKVTFSVETHVKQTPAAAGGEQQQRVEKQERWVVGGHGGGSGGHSQSSSSGAVTMTAGRTELDGSDCESGSFSSLSHTLEKKTNGQQPPLPTPRPPLPHPTSLSKDSRYTSNGIQGKK